MILIIYEIIYYLGLLFHLTEAITRTITLDRKASSNPQFLNVLTKPLTHRIIQVGTFLFRKTVHLFSVIVG